MTWLEEIVNALEALGGEAHYSDLYNYIQRTSKRRLPTSWQAIVRQTIEDHSSDAMFRSGKDIFYSVGGKGSGHWGLRNMHQSQRQPQIAKPETSSSPPKLPTTNTDSPPEPHIVTSPTKAVDLAEPTIPDRATIEVTRIIRDTGLSKALKEIYDDKCQVCGTIIKLVNRNYSETHHLQPLGGDHKGPDIQSNMIVVCPNHHSEFDYGAIAINPESLEITAFDGRNLGKLRVNEGHQLDKRYLEYHFYEVFMKGNTQ